jgi:predicted dehydrogenase
METKTLGIILNGVTGRMGTNQHLIRSILAIMKQGGVKVWDDLRLMPEPILTGRNAEKLRELAETQGHVHVNKPLKWTTDLSSALGDSKYSVFFDASGTLQRARFIEMAVKAGKSIYCEKPTAVETSEALRLAKLCESAKLKNGVVQDKLWLPGMRKIAMLRQQGFFGDILSVRGNFGYWVFTGEIDDQPAQRPSWNYRKEDGGGIIIDMFCHWQYVVSNLFGPIDSLVAYGNVDLPKRVDESGKTYKPTADDSAYAIFKLHDGTLCQFNSSWCTRVRRDDLLTIQVDGAKGSCVAGLREAWVQGISETPKPVWNPDILQPIDFYSGWQKVPDATHYDNAFKIQWELFLRHVALDEPFRWTLREGARGVQLAELGIESWKQRRWMDVPELE